jgi:predicted ATPase/DNA-binding CsgD family transcriptional regulator
MVVTHVAGAGQLPAETDEFVGRAAELRQIAGLLQDRRLVTLVGPGGVGKTRVALRAAKAAEPRYPDGLCLVELSGLRDPALLPHTTADRLGLAELGGAVPRDTLAGQLRDRRLLLILDTCEHLIDACAELAEAILARAPGVTVLATSREPLAIAGETTYLIPPLSVPAEETDALEDTGDAVALFERRAAAIVPGFAVTDDNRADVIRLCRGLDGIPLTIELAAGRLRQLSFAEIMHRLDQRLSLLTGGKDGRHATARTAVGWSYDTCTPAERALWARLSVFPDSFDVASAAEVCASGELSDVEIFETIIRLVDKSLLVPAGADGMTPHWTGPNRTSARDRGRQPRFRMLDTVREFGAEQLAATGDLGGIRDRFIARYLALARHVDEHVFDDNQLELFSALRREHANLRAALKYALDDEAGQPWRERDGGELANRLWMYWLASGRMLEGSYWHSKALDRAPRPTPKRAFLLLIRCFLGALQGTIGEAIADGREAVEIGIALKQPLLTGRAQTALCLALTFGGDLSEAVKVGRSAERLLTQADDRVGLIVLDAHLTGTYFAMEKAEKALWHYRRGIARFGERSRERLYHGYLHVLAGMAYLLLPGQEDECAKVLSLALTAKYDLDEVTGSAYALESLGWLAVNTGRHQRAAWLLGAAQSLWNVCGARLSHAPAWEERHQRAVASITAALGPAAYSELFEAGRRHPLDQVVALAINDADSLADRVPGVAHPGLGTLTDREQEVAYLAAAGLSAGQIARQLFLPEPEIAGHLATVFAKLGVSSAAQLGPWLG